MLKLALRFALGSGETRAQNRARLHGKSRSESRSVAEKFALGNVGTTRSTFSENWLEIALDLARKRVGYRARLFRKTGWISRSKFTATALGSHTDSGGEPRSVFNKVALRSALGSGKSRVRGTTRSTFATNRESLSTLPGNGLGIALDLSRKRVGDLARNLL